MANRCLSCERYVRHVTRNYAKNNAGEFYWASNKNKRTSHDINSECSGRYTLIRSVARIPSLPESPPAHPPLSATPVATYSRALLFSALSTAAPLLYYRARGTNVRKITHAGVSDR